MNLLLVTGTRAKLTMDGIKYVTARTIEAKPWYPGLIIHGDCETGVDRHMRILCELEFIGQANMPAQWKRDGKRAGPIRNRAMVDVCKQLSRYGWSVRVAAFPYGKSPGTRGCIKLAEAAGFPVEVFELSEEHVK